MSKHAVLGSFSGNLGTAGSLKRLFKKQHFLCAASVYDTIHIHLLLRELIFLIRCVRILCKSNFDFFFSPMLESGISMGSQECFYSFYMDPYFIKVN